MQSYKSGVGISSLLLNENAHIVMSHFAACVKLAVLIKWWTYLIPMSCITRVIAESQAEMKILKVTESWAWPGNKADARVH